MEVGGYKVMDSLRLEKGYRYYTTDVTPLETPYEAGLGFCGHLGIIRRYLFKHEGHDGDKGKTLSKPY